MPPALTQLAAQIRASKLSHTLIALLAALAAVGVTIIVAPDHTVTVRVGKAAPAPVAPAIALKREAAAPTPASYTAAMAASNELASTDLRGADVAPPAGAVPVRAAAASVNDTNHYATTERLHSPNFSTRTAPIGVIILHSTESSCTPGRTADLLGVGHFLSLPSVRASIEVINNCDGKDLRLLPDFVKAWHVMTYNSVAVGLEQIGRAAQTSWPAAQLRNTALWISRWSKAYSIPIQVGAVTVRNGAPVVLRKGVLRHMDLGVAGGGHHDPGAAYPFARVLAMARAIAAPAVVAISSHTKTVCRKYAWFGPVGSSLARSRSSHQRLLHGQRRRYLLRNHIACSVAGVAARR